MLYIAYARLKFHLCYSRAVASVLRLSLHNDRSVFCNVSDAKPGFLLASCVVAGLRKPRQKRVGTGLIRAGVTAPDTQDSHSGHATFTPSWRLQPPFPLPTSQSIREAMGRKAALSSFMMVLSGGRGFILQPDPCDVLCLDRAGRKQ